MTAEFFSNSIFWVDIDKIKPNPYQPRREFEEGPLRDLSESIRQYGVMQPLTVTRVEFEKPEGGIAVEYELIAGERRLRASKLAGLSQVPVLIRMGDTPQEKLELAIIENLQRSDLNPVERAHAFARLANEFKLQHAEIGRKVGRSREYVSNTLRILSLPEEMLSALAEGKISEGHTRPLLMLIDRPEEQMVLFKEIMNKKVTVREAERAARTIAVERARKQPVATDPTLVAIEHELQGMLGERVHVEQDTVGGRVTISFLTPDELKTILDQLKSVTAQAAAATESAPLDEVLIDDIPPAEAYTLSNKEIPTSAEVEKKIAQQDDSDLYSMSNFSI
jgi:ParB family chromosome partitioning protein